MDIVNILGFHSFGNEILPFCSSLKLVLSSLNQCFCLGHNDVLNLLYFKLDIFLMVFPKLESLQQNPDVPHTHRLVEVDRNLWRSFSSTLCSKQDHLQETAWGHVLNRSKGEDTTTFLVNPCQCLTTQSTKVFSST